jgi:hypothetical protein
MATATAVAFFWARPSARAQEGQLRAPHRMSRSRRFPYLRPCVSFCVSFSSFKLYRICRV